MSLTIHLEELQKKSGLTMYAMSKKLGLKSHGHVWMLKTGIRKPSISTCFKIIGLAKEHGISLTLDDLRGDG